MEDSKESRLRAEFEAWAIRSGWMPFNLTRRDGEGHYADYAIEESWSAYRAASASRSEILEALDWLVQILPDPELDNDELQRVWTRKARALLAKYQGE